MARKGNGSTSKSSKKAAASAAEEPKQLTVVPIYPPSFPSFYANYASVSHTASEVFIDCCVMGMPYNVNLEEGQVMTPVVARIILPPSVATGLITALQSQTEKQKDTVKAGTLVVPIPKSKEA